MGTFKYGKFHVNPEAPEAYGICDRCGAMHNHSHLRFQHEIRGNKLVKTQLLVCARCEDAPAEFLRTIRIPPDPVPIKNPRPIQTYSLEPVFYDDEETYDDGEIYGD
jgi:hypothetical protein